MDNSAIYVNADAIRRQHIADTSPSPQLTARNRSPRSVLVCLVVLCVLLLTAVIVLCVLIYTNNHQFHINNKNITQERDKLLTKYTNITQERDKLLTKYTNITQERDQLLTKYTNITVERNQLQTKYTNVTEEKDQLLTNNIKLTEERDELTAKYYYVTELYKELNWKKNLIWKHLRDGWIYHEDRLYLISSELNNWDESRSYCRERGADLIIINNKEEQDFVKNIISGAQVWIGLSDIDVEGTWTWVDGSTLTSGFSFWYNGEPDGKTEENCALSQPEWHDHPCTVTLTSICEKNIF